MELPHLSQERTTMLIAAIIGGVTAGLLASILGRHAGTAWAAFFGAAWIASVFLSEVVTDTISLTVAGAALVSFGAAKVLHDATGFLERREVRATL
jgi:hypothetical protein